MIHYLDLVSESTWRKLHYVHQRVSDCVCLLFAAQQVVDRGCLQMFPWKHLATEAKKNAMRAVRLNQNSNVVARSKKQGATDAKDAQDVKDAKALNEGRWVIISSSSHYKQPNSQPSHVNPC